MVRGLEDEYTVIAMHLKYLLQEALLLLPSADNCMSAFVFRQNHHGAALPCGIFRMKIRRAFSVSTTLNQAKPKSGSIVDKYQTVSVNCKCGERLFRYKKKNGTKSQLVKLFVDRISEDCVGLMGNEKDITEQKWECPKCQTSFARPALIRGRPALKLIGGKTRMTKK